MHKSGVEDFECEWTFTMIDWREEVRENMKKRHTANYTSTFPQQTFWSGRRVLLCRGVR